MADVQLILCISNRKSPKSPKYHCLCGNRGQGIECWCQNFNQKLINSRFCICTVKT